MSSNFMGSGLNARQYVKLASQGRLNPQTGNIIPIRSISQLRSNNGRSGYAGANMNARNGYTGARSPRTSYASGYPSSSRGGAASSYSPRAYQPSSPSGRAGSPSPSPYSPSNRYTGNSRYSTNRAYSGPGSCGYSSPASRYSGNGARNGTANGYSSPTSRYSGNGVRNGTYNGAYSSGRYAGPGNDTPNHIINDSNGSKYNGSYQPGSWSSARSWSSYV